MPAATLDLLDVLKSVKVDGHQQYEALEIFHLRWAVDGHRLDYLTLDEALETKCIEVAESSQSGHVPQIKIINRSDRMIFLMAGEQVVGCKQNRVLNASMMVPARSEMPL
ncbi:MAG: ARPP-1 family domain-containing protein, partial [Terriglobales bacterium]